MEGVYFGGYGETAANVAIQEDGKIILVGSTQFDEYFALARLNTNGIADSSFGTFGLVQIDLGGFLGSGRPQSIVIQPDGKIILAGHGNDGELIITRFSVNGSLDSTFSEDGIITRDILSGFDGAFMDVELQDDGKIIAAGYSDYIGSSTTFVIVRCISDGTLDTTFATGGIAEIADSFNIECYALSIQLDGKILLSGTLERTDTDYDYIVVRLNNNGTLDSSFGTDGMVISDFITSHDRANDMLLAEDGKIIVGGVTSSVDDEDFFLIRYNTDGTVDNTFGTDGKIITNFGSSDDGVIALALQNDGNIIAVGSTELIGIDRQIALARYISCSAYFTMYPDTIPHNWIAVNMAEGVDPINYVWEWGDGTSSTEEFPTHIYDIPGYYNICLTINDAAGCMSTYCDSSTYLYRMTEEQTMITVNVLDGGLTTNNFIDLSSISLGPNPFSDQISIFGIEPNGVVALFDLSGKLVLSQETFESVLILDTSNQPAGLYFLIYSDGTNYHSAKIIKN